MGEAYQLDASRVANIIQSLIAGNIQAETKVQTITATTGDGGAMFKALDEHYLGVGVFAMETTAAEKVLETIYYTGERKPHMWWLESKRQLTSAYATIDKAEGREVYSNAQKLRSLMSKVKADFLGHQVTAIGLKLSEMPMVYTFEQAIISLRNAVNLKHPPSMTDNSSTSRTTCHVRETNSRGRGGSHGGRGRGGRGRQPASRQHEHTLKKDSFKQRHDVRKARNDSEIVRLNNGKWTEYHPSFVYVADMYQEFPQELKAKMNAQRDEYRASRNNGPASSSTGVSVVDSVRQIQALQLQLDSLRSAINPAPVPQNIAVDTQTQVSQVSYAPTNPSIMGGRNDQANRHQPRNINKIYSQRSIISASNTRIAQPNPQAATTTYSG